MFNPEALPVGSSPYYSTVTPASPSASAFILSGAALNGVVHQGSKTAVTLSIAPKDAHGNTLALGEGSLSDFKILLSVQIADDGLFEITDNTLSYVEGGESLNLEFTVDRAGLLEVEILFKNVPIMGNPFRIPVNAASEDIDPALTKFDGLMLQGMVGEEISLDVALVTSAGVSCYSTSMNSPQQEIMDASARIEKALGQGYGGISHSSSKGADYVKIMSDFQEISVRDNADGTYSASVRFTETDIHVVEAKIGPDTGSKFIGDSARAIGTGLSQKMKIYSGRTETAALKDLEGAPITGPQVLVAGVPFDFNVYPADEFANIQDYVYHTEDEFRVSSVHNLLGLGTSAVCAKKMYEGVGIATFYFSCSMTATVAGDYSLDVAFRERGSREDFARISGISVELSVRPTFPDWEQSEISGEGLNEAYVGSESFVRLNLVDMYGNEVNDGSNVAEFEAYGKSPVNATLVETVTSASIPLDVQYNADLKEYGATYTPEVSGVFTLNVFVAGKLMQIPGYENTVLHPGTIEPSRCIAWGAGVGESGPIAAGVSQKFLIQAMDSQGNQLAEGGATFKAILRSAAQPDPILNNYVPDGRVITSLHSITDFGNGLYEVSYEPRIAATYLLEVLRGGSHVVGSPFVVDVKAAPTEANQTQVYCDPGVPCSLGTNMAGRQSFFFVQARDKYSGNRTDFDDLVYYSVTSDAGFSKESIAAPRGNDYGGVYQGSFSVQTAGQVRVAVMFGSELAAEFTSPIVPSPVDSTNCALLSSDFPETDVYSSSGSPHEIVLASMDRFSNRVYEGGREVKGLLVKSDGTLTQELSFTDNSDGTYTDQYINKEPGDYSVTATVDGESVLPRPLRLVPGDLVLSKTAVSSSPNFEDTGIGDVYIGEFLKFFIRFSDEWGNVREGRLEDLTSVGSSLMIKIDGDEREVAAKISDRRPPFVWSSLVEPAGVYQVEFNALLTGDLEFLLKQNYKGSDNMVSFPGSLVSTVPDVSQSSVYGPGVTAVVGGSVVTYFTDMKDSHGNALTEVRSLPSVSMRLLSNEGPSQEELDGSVRDVIRGGGSLVIVEYKLPAFGLVYSVEITTSVDGATVSVDTVRVAVMTGVVAPSRSILQDSKSRQIKETTLKATSGVESAVYVQARDANSALVSSSLGPGWVTVRASPSLAALQVTEEEGGRFKITMTGTVAGEYALFIYSGGVPLGETGEYRLRILPRFPSSSARTAVHYPTRSGPQTITAGLPHVVNVRTFDAYGNRQDALSGTEIFIAAVIKTDEESLSPPVEYSSEGAGEASYDIVCSVSRAGTYEVQVLMVTEGFKQPLDTSILEVLHAPYVPLSSEVALETDAGGLVAGERVALRVVPRDKYGNEYLAGDLDLALQVSGVAFTDKSWRLNKDGTYTLEFTPVESGAVSFFVEDEPTESMIGGRYEYVVSHGAISLDSTVVSGLGLHGGRVGQDLSVTVQAFDSYGNAMKILADNVRLNVEHVEGGHDASINPSQESDWGSIVLSYVPNTPGMHRISVVLYGDSLILTGGSEWKSGIEVLPAPSPEMVSLTFRDTLAGLDLVFDVPTNRGESGQLDDDTSNCSNYFGEDSVSRFGDDPRCVWQDDSTLVVYFGQHPLLMPEDRVTIKPETVLSKAGNSYPSEGRMYPTLPALKPSPSLSVSVPQNVGVCDDLVVDASGSSGGAGRALKFTAGIFSADTDASDVNDFLQTDASHLYDESWGTQGASSWLIPADMLSPDAQYTVFVKATNWVGEEATGSFSVKKGSFPIPSLTIAGGRTIRGFRGRSMYVEADLALPSPECLKKNFAEVGSEIEYQWQQLRGPPLRESIFPSLQQHALHSRSLTSKNLFLPADCLQPLSEYKFQVRALPVANSALATTAEVVVDVGLSKLEATIAGGLRSVQSSSPLTIHADVRDPDNVLQRSGSPAIFSYRWTCTDAGGSACSDDPDLQKQLLEAGNSLNIGPTIGAYLSPGAYKFTLEVEKEPLVPGRSAKAAAEVVVVADNGSDPGSIAIDPVPATVASNERLTQRAEAYPGPQQIVWSSSLGDVEAKLDQLIESGAISETGQGSEYFSLSPGTLTEGLEYSFRASLKDRPSVYSEITVTARAAPRGGGGLASPPSGVAGQTVFTITAHGWESQGGSLTYEFWHLSGDMEQALSARQRSNSLRALLPEGKHKIVIYVSDQLGAYARHELDGYVTVAGPVSSGKRSLLTTTEDEVVPKLNSTLHGGIEHWMNLGEFTKALQMVGVYSSYLSASSGENEGVLSSCSDVSIISKSHAHVLRNLRDMQAAVPFTPSRGAQYACRAADLVRDASTVSSAGAQAALDLVTSQIEKIKFGELALTDNGERCVSDLLSGLYAHKFSGCKDKGTSGGVPFDSIQALADTLAEGILAGLPPGVPASLSTPTFQVVAQRF